MSRLAARLGLNTIFAKVLIISLSILGVTFLVFNLVSTQLVRRDMFDRQQGMEGAELRRTVKLLETAASERWTESMVSTALKVVVPPQMKSILVIDSTGRYMQVGDVPLPASEIKSIISEANIGSSGQFRSQMIENESGKWIVSSQYVPSIDRYVVSLSTGFQRDFRRWQNLSWLAIAVALAVSAVFSWLFSRYMTTRIRRMSLGAERFAKGDFDTPIRDASPDELGRLAGSLNRMAVDLGALEQTRRDFLANVSHDLRSPLTSIHGYVEAILDGTIPGEKADRYLRITQEQTVRLMKLVNDLLDMSKIESGQFDVQPAEFDLAETVRLLLARMESTFRHHGVRYEIKGRVDSEPGPAPGAWSGMGDEGAGDGPGQTQGAWSGTGNEGAGDGLAVGSGKVIVVGDAHRLEQVMVNLIQNAMAFSPQGSTVYVTLDAQEEQACLTVRDEGIGMSPEETERIWERFYKTDEARSGRGGTGIGLSIVKHILDAHGSRIAVRSEQGRGSSFSFCLQRAAGGAGAEAAADEQQD
ncbi:HAMP domain-containing sensor histidine kinase [Paenibacillus sp. P22]|uniref:HAMP domain-containing sensor histidine kinase n=1 Tax=Paenibacillus sp. P22 TaxID=483908 RepID=UPI00038F5258|nr:HAMP domain-containing sensor histidine kinase [Paenibacillus sp. P22]CDN42937.1 Integral membrane sensor signal transduction histidine kinase [Paenibacillus sp. P22]